MYYVYSYESELLKEQVVVLIYGLEHKDNTNNIDYIMSRVIVHIQGANTISILEYVDQIIPSNTEVFKFTNILDALIKVVEIAEEHTI